MAFRREKRAWWAIVSTVAAGVILYVAGCKTAQSLHAQPAPVQGEIVGGGLRIEWVAPAKGTVYLVETTTGRIMETRSLDQGNTYSFAAPMEGPKNDFERVLGIKLSDARFVLYFQPASPTKSTAPAQ
jgi:hypothetical protein